MKYETKERLITVVISVIILAVICVPLGLKFFAKQSGASSRFGGGPVILQVPKDCKKILNISKNGTGKYIVYIDSEGRVKMKEYSDFGILEAEYVVEGYVDEEVKNKE